MDSAVIRDSNTGPSYSGGAVVSYGPVNISNSTFENNSGGSGGAPYARFTAAFTEIWNTTFRNNHNTSPTSGWGGYDHSQQQL